MKIKKRKPAFFIIITLLIFYALFQKVDYRLLKEIFSSANLFYLTGALFTILFAPILSAKKWQSVLRAMDYKISFRNSFKIIMASQPLSAVTPSKSGDLIRAFYLKDSLPPARTAGAVLAERLTDVMVLAFYSFAGALLLKNNLILGISLAIIALIPLLVWIAGKIKLPWVKLQEKIDNFFFVSKILLAKPRKSLFILLYSLLLWLVPVFEAKLLFLAFGASVPWLYIVAAFPITIFIGLLPITIAGMGTRDSAIIYFFSSWTQPGICLAVGLMYSLLGYWLLALLGLPFMRRLLKELK